jgi:hypothetical protein
MHIRGRIACSMLAPALLFAAAAPAQNLPSIPSVANCRPGYWCQPIPDEQLPPFKDVPMLRLTLDANGSYVLGTDPLLLRATLSINDPNHSVLLAWRHQISPSGPIGLTYNITGPNGLRQTIQICRNLGDTSETTREVGFERPYEEEIDLAAPICSDTKITQPGHYSIQADLKHPVCEGPSAYDCIISDEYGEFSMLTIASNTVEFDVLPPYTADNPAPSESAPPATADPQIHAWLNSGNPRMEAWASYFILRDHPAGVVSDLQSWLESTIAEDRLPPADRKAYWFDKDSLLDKERSQAAHAVLDALIQSRVQLSTAQIQVIAANDSVLGLIFAMLPKWNEAAVLNIFDLIGGFKFDPQQGNGDPSHPWRGNARYIAGEALAVSGSRAFLAEFTAGFVLHLEFEATPAERKATYFQRGPNFMWGRPCGAGGSFNEGRADSVTGWPPIGNYGLSEGVPKQIMDWTNPPSYKSFDPANAVSLGQSDLYYTRLVSDRYGAAAFAQDDCGDDINWLQQYGHHDERFETRTVLFATGDDDYHDQLTKWVGGLGAAHTQILSDAGATPVPLKITLHGIDFLHPAPGSNVSDAYKFDFPGFPPAGITVIPH